MTGLSSVTGGAEELRQKFARFFEAVTPPVIEAAWEEYDIDPWLLPKFAVYDGVDPMKVTSFPALCSGASTDTNHTVTDINADGSIETWPVYSWYVAVVAMTPYNRETNKWADPDYDNCIRLMNRLTAIVQNVLINSPGLLDPDTVSLDRSSINTTYHDVLPASGAPRKWVSSSIMTMTVKQRAVTWQPKIGTVNQTMVLPGILTT